MKSKLTAGLLALLLGDLGLHKFYLGQTKSGVIYLLFSWTFIPALISLIDGISLLTMSDDEFNEKYNAESETNATPQNNKNTSNSHSESDNIDLLLKYKKLLDENVITQEEFDTFKRNLMNENHNS